MRRYTRPAVGMLALAALALTGCQSPDAEAADPSDQPITIAMIPLAEDPNKVNPIDELTRLLEEQTGREVEITDVPDYLSVVEALRAGHVDIGFMSGFPSALAVNTGEVDPLLAWKGSDEPVSTCVVLEDSPVRELTDLKDKTVAFADPASSSGFFMPVYMLHEAGLERDTDYKGIFAGGHDGSFVALKEGQVDAACTSNELIELGPPNFPFEEGQWRGVGQSPSMDIMGTVLARQDLDETTRTQLQEAIPAIVTEGNKQNLGGLGTFAGLEVSVAPEPAEYATFAEIAEVAGTKLEDLK